MVEIKHRWSGKVIKMVDADNLCGADLCGADLCGADLRGANLYGADLCGADLRGANLCDADLRGAKRYMDGEPAITLVGKRPIIAIGPIGSRNDELRGLITSAGLRIECGCFCGTLDAFREKVTETHGNGRHGVEYMAASAFIEAWAAAEMAEIKSVEANHE